MNLGEIRVACHRDPCAHCPPKVLLLVSSFALLLFPFFNYLSRPPNCSRPRVFLENSLCAISTIRFVSNRFSFAARLCPFSFSLFPPSAYCHFFHISVVIFNGTLPTHCPPPPPPSPSPSPSHSEHRVVSVVIAFDHVHASSDVCVTPVCLSLSHSIA